MKRFWKTAVAGGADNAFGVRLDGRAVRTQGGRPQIVPSLALAQAMADEWASQPDEIDPALFVLRDLADMAIDVVAQDRAGTIAALLRYGQTDTLCYRAEPDEPLHEHQCAVWDPLLHKVETRWDIHFERIAGVMHRPQPETTLLRLEAVLSGQSAFALAALSTLGALAASLVVALLALEPDADATALWDAANLEEDWQTQLWGKDGEALARRAQRGQAFAAALEFARLAAA